MERNDSSLVTGAGACGRRASWAMRLIGPLLVLLSATFASGQATVAELLRPGDRGGDDALPDFSLAGYGRGKPLPTPRAATSVTRFGAKADDEGDDTAAFRRALEEAAGRVIAVPAGRYVLSDQLVIDSSRTVLQGAGSGKTTLSFTRSLEDLQPTPAKTGHGTATTRWSWDGGLVTIGSAGRAYGGPPLTPGTAERGDKALALPNHRFRVGDAIYIHAQNDEGNALADHLYAGDIRRGDTELGPVRAGQVAIVVTANRDRVTLDRPLRFDVRPQWTEVYRFDPKVVESGVEGLTVEFPGTPYRGHFKEDGWNGFEIGRGAVNCWLRDVAVVNGDSGVYINGHNNTVDGLVIRADRKPDGSGDTGHHAIHIGGTDNVVTNFDLQTRTIHDLGIGAGSVGNVYSAGRGVDLSMDHHRWAPYRNLYTDLDAGKGTRHFKSGGTSRRGRHSATGAVFWNIRSERAAKMPGDDFAPPVGVFLVGVQGLTPEAPGGARKGWVVLPLDVEGGEPRDLYLHQQKVPRR